MGTSFEPAFRQLQGYAESIIALLPTLGIGAVVLVLFLVAAAGAQRAIVGVALRRQRPDLGRLLAGFVRWSVILFGLLVVATIVFPSIKPADLLATFGFGSVAIGFAFKDILQNWLSGILILYRQPFRRGDQIVSGPFEGIVEAIEARATLIRTYAGERVVIPNSDIYTRATTVRTAFPLRRSEYEVGIGYGDDVERACAVIREALRGAEGLAQDPAPEAIPWALDGSSVAVKVRWWSSSAMADVVESRGRVIATVKRALGEAGIDLPFPTRVVLLHDQTEETDGDRARQREGWPAGDAPPRPRHLNALRMAGESSQTGGSARSREGRRDGPEPLGLSTLWRRARPQGEPSPEGAREKT